MVVVDGSDVLATLLYDRTTSAGQKRGRFRAPNQDKVVFPSSPWIWFADIPAIEQERTRMIRAFKKHAATLGGVCNHVTFHPAATLETITETFAESGLFDVVKIDKERGIARKIA